MKSSVLLVGGPTTELPEVAAALSALAPDWNCQHVPNGLAALDVLTRQPCDVVVADLQLGDLTGLQLLNQVMTQWPQIHRVILADLDAFAHDLHAYLATGARLDGGGQGSPGVTPGTLPGRPQTV